MTDAQAHQHRIHRARAYHKDGDGCRRGFQRVAAKDFAEEQERCGECGGGGEKHQMPPHAVAERVRAPYERVEEEAQEYRAVGRPQPHVDLASRNGERGEEHCREGGKPDRGDGEFVHAGAEQHDGESAAHPEPDCGKHAPARGNRAEILRRAPFGRGSYLGRGDKRVGRNAGVVVIGAVCLVHLPCSLL